MVAGPVESNKTELSNLKSTETAVEEFRTAGYKHVDWVADYLLNPRKYPVATNAKPGEVTARLSASTPETGESLETIFSDFQSLLLPGLTLWNHPRFFGYFS